MPFTSPSDLPKEIKERVPEDKQGQFVEVFNEVFERTQDEGRAMAAANSAIRKEETFKAPESARNNAKRALRWREEHGEEVKGGTRVGWERANQLANNENLSLDTVQRMASFARHEKNSDVDPQHKDEPWKDAGHVAWLLWGGDSGVSWAKEISERVEKMALKVGDRVSWDSSGGKASGIIREVVTEGNVPNIPVKVTGSEDEPAARIEITNDDGEPTGEMVGHKLSTVSKSYSLNKNTILKVDEEQRIVYGWASVSTVKGETIFDKQGDSISPDEMEKASTRFMKSARTAKAMHKGGAIGEVVHSFPITKTISDALDISSDKEGWIVGVFIKDDSTWERVKSGELQAFSIGGKGVRDEV